jgi:hypothetical protein
MEKQYIRSTARYCVKIGDKQQVTTVVYLASGDIVVVIVHQNGNVETLMNPP